jgi:hypothetical protein
LQTHNIKIKYRPIFGPTIAIFAAFVISTKLLGAKTGSSNISAYPDEKTISRFFVSVSAFFALFDTGDMVQVIRKKESMKLLNLSNFVGRC